MTTKIYRRRGRRNNRRPIYITKFAVFCHGCGAGYVQVCDGSYPAIS